MRLKTLVEVCKTAIKGVLNLLHAIDAGIAYQCDKVLNGDDEEYEKYEEV